VHITERVLHTEVQRTGSVAYRQDPAAIGFDLPEGQTVTGCRYTQLKPRFPVVPTTYTQHSHTSFQFWTRTVTETLPTPVHMRYQTQVQCISYSVHMKWSYEFTVCTVSYIDERDEWRSNQRGTGLCRMKKYRCYCFRNGVTVGVEGSVKKMEIGCSEVNVMVQEDMMDRSFLHDQEKTYRYSFMCQV